MKLSKIILIVCCFVILPLCSKAVDGCLIITDKTVYPNQVDPGLLGLLALLLGGAPAYDNTSPQYDACGWTPASGTVCKVCKGVWTKNIFGVINGCSIPLENGVKGTFTVVACSIDDYNYILILIIAGTGVYSITKKKDLH